MTTMTLTTFTSTGTETNKKRQTQTKPRDDYRVIFADRVRYHKDKVYVRDEEGHIKKNKKGLNIYDLVKDENRMLGAPRKIFNTEREYKAWTQDRHTFGQIEDVELESDDDEIDEMNSELIRE